MRLTATAMLASGLLLITLFQDSCKAIPVEEDLTLTLKEIWALENFRTAVDSYLTKSYMKKDIYLIKWLRARNLNVNAAKQMLINNLRWRKEYGMDGIIGEDFSQFELQFPFMMDGLDYTCRPVVAGDVALWDVRRAILSGQRETLNRHLFRTLEMQTVKVRDLQSQGQNVTQFIVLLNLKGFNLIQHGCIQCIQVYVNFVLAFENYYPGMVHLIVGINTPSSFQIILNALRPVMSKMTEDALVLYGNNKEEWTRAVRNMIPPDQIDEQFGGNRID